MRRLAQAAADEPDPAAASIALERARVQVEALAESAAQLEATLPDRVGEAVREGLRQETLPVARQLAETRGLAAQTIRRLEGIEHDLLAERSARIDDLALLVDLVVSGWKGIDDRLARIDAALATAGVRTSASAASGSVAA